MKNLLLLVLGTLLIQPALAQRTAALTALLQRHAVPGAQVVYTKGKTVEAYNLGVREAATKQPRYGRYYLRGGLAG